MARSQSHHVYFMFLLHDMNLLLFWEHAITTRYHDILQGIETGWVFVLFPLNQHCITPTVLYSISGDWRSLYVTPRRKAGISLRNMEQIGHSTQDDGQ